MMPGPVVVQAALMVCDGGVAPVPLAVTSNPIVKINELPVATVADCAPLVNIPSFGVCSFLTAKAAGIPMPCVPAPTGMWQPGSAVQKINELAVLTLPATLPCAQGGTITVTAPGQVTEESA
jgi:hypothetical protein